MLQTLPWAAGLLACAIAAWTDVTTRRVPNWLTIPLAVSAPFLMAVNGLHAFGAAWLVLAGALAIGVVLHVAGLFGGGDVKLLVGVAVLAGLPGCFEFALYTALAGGVVAVVMLLMKKQARLIGSVFTRFAYSIANGGLGAAVVAESDARMPYALAIFAGFLTVMLAHSAVPFLRIIR